MVANMPKLKNVEVLRERPNNPIFGEGQSMILSTDQPEITTSDNDPSKEESIARQIDSHVESTKGNRRTKGLPLEPEETVTPTNNTDDSKLTLRSTIDVATTVDLTVKRKRRKNPFITFFLLMYKRRPKRRAAAVARLAGRRWRRMSPQKRSKYIAMSLAEYSER